MLEIPDDCDCPLCAEIRLLRRELELVREWGAMWKSFALAVGEVRTS